MLFTLSTEARVTQPSRMSNKVNIHNASCQQLNTITLARDEYKYTARSTQHNVESSVEPSIISFFAQHICTHAYRQQMSEYITGVYDTDLKIFF